MTRGFLRHALMPVLDGYAQGILSSPKGSLLEDEIGILKPRALGVLLQDIGLWAGRITRPEPGDSPSYILRRYADALFNANDWAGAEPYYRQALACAVSVDEVARAQLGLGTLLRPMGNYGEARVMLRNARGLALRENMVALLRDIDAQRAWIAYHSGDHHRAIRILLRQTPIDYHMLGRALGESGHPRSAIQSLHRYRRTLEEAKHLMGETGYRHMVGFNALREARVLARTGRFDEASALTEISDRCLEGHPFFPLNVAVDAGATLLRQGRGVAAATVFEETAARWHVMGGRPGVVENLVWQTRALYSIGDKTGARRALDRAMYIARLTDSPKLVAICDALSRPLAAGESRRTLAPITI